MNAFRMFGLDSDVLCLKKNNCKFGYLIPKDRSETTAEMKDPVVALVSRVVPVVRLT